MFLFIVVLLVAAGLPLVASADQDLPNCLLNDGCASASVCRCTSFFTECDTSSNAQGYCKLTPWGIALIALTGVAVVFCITLVFCLLYYCKKVFCCCCKSRERHAPMHTTVYYHPAQPYGVEGHEVL